MESEPDQSGGGFGTLGTAIGALVVAWVAVVASFPLNDNSFFTHLATGRLILDRGSVPSSDPYSYTAAGADWTVQSWLASVVYAGAEQVGGAVGVRVVVLALMVIAGLLVWRLSRPATSIVVRLLIVAVALFVATGLWGERPYMVGVIGLAVVWLALDGAVRPWLLVPLLWVWGNSHGSYPLAFVLIVLVIAGTLVDRRGDGVPAREQVAVELRVLAMTALGTVLAVIGPLGIEVLTFPVKALTQSEVFAHIIEWQAPRLRSTSEQAFLVLVLLAFLAVARRASWRLALPAVVFAGAGLYAQRNVVMATIVLVPVIASCAPSFGTLRSDSRPGPGSVFSAITVAFAALFCVGGVLAPATGFGAYPARALAWLDEQGEPLADSRLMHDMPTGNLLEVLDGAEARVFIDDRVDMYPNALFEDHIDLTEGSPAWHDVLDDHNVDVVVWGRERALASLLRADERWRTVYTDTDWIVACRRGTAACR